MQVIAGLDLWGLGCQSARALQLLKSSLSPSRLFRLAPQLIDEKTHAIDVA